MNSKLEMAKPSKLALVDWGWISAALIFLALMCFCILFFVKGAEPDGMALGRAEGGARLLSAESVSRTQKPAALRECGCEPGKALSVKRTEMKASALSVQMSSVKWSICRSQGCRQQTISVFVA